MLFVGATGMAIAASCGTLAAVHALVWARQRTAVNGAFALLAASVAGLALVELQLMQATTPAEYGRWLWWYHWPIMGALVATVLLVRGYLQAGRLWLGGLAIALRAVAFVMNLFATPNLNFRDITALERVTVFGDQMAVPYGTTNPWILVGQAALVALVVFVADATLTAWRRGDRQRALTVGGSLLAFISAGVAMSIATLWGVVKLPFFAAVFFLPLVLIMAAQLSLDLARAASMAQRLQRSEDTLALAAEAAHAGLWRLDRASGRLWATRQALAMFGLAPGGQHGAEALIAAVHPDDQARVRAFLLDGPAREARRVVDFRVQVDGSTRWLASRGSAAAAPGVLMGVTLDITERRRADDEAATQRLELEHLARVATLAELSGTLAHEVNQPLAVIMSNAEAAQRLLERPTADLAELQAMLRDIVAADERASAVITRLRALLRRNPPELQPHALDALVHGVLAFMRADLIRRGVTVVPVLAAGLPPVAVDRVGFEQVLINLLINASDAMLGNADGDRELRIETRAHAGHALLEVSDQGRGLPALPARMFEPFFTTKQHGLGMGLAIARSIVVAHGGRVAARANAGRGATLSVELPFAVLAP